MKKFNLINLTKQVLLGGALLASSSIFAQNNSVYDVISGSSVHQTLKLAIDEAGLDGALDDPNSSLTVFAPTDDAFADALEALNLTAPELLASDDLSNILLYHVLGAEVVSTGLENAKFATTLNGDSVFVSLLSSGVFIDQSQVTTPDVNADNGVVHIVNSVLLPQNTLVDVAVSNGFSILTQAVVTAELAPALLNPYAPLTVFAPTDAAFVAFLDEVGLSAEDLLADEDLADILLYHVLGGVVESGDLSNGTFATTLNGDSAFVSLLSSGVFIDQAQVTTPDVAADNGVIHIVNDVILPQNSIIDVAVTNGFSILAQAVVAAELAPALVDPLAGLTVFAPTDDAFVGLLGELELTAEELLASDDLADILLYHVVEGIVGSGDLSNGTFATTLNGDSAFVSLLSSGVFIDQAQVTASDIPAENGIIHIVNDVILPQNSIIDVAVANGFSILAQAVVAAELAPALVDPLAGLTVFAPTDDAFVGLLGELELTAEELLASDDLADILLYHVLGNVVESGILSNGTFATTLNGDSAFVSLLSTGVFIDQAQVTTPDVAADNGVVHILNDVLLPQNSIIDVAVANGFTILTQAVVTAELVPALIDPLAGLTVFAPTDDAFADALEALELTAEELLASDDLASILLYHVVEGVVESGDLSDGLIVTTLLSGESLTFDLTDGVKVNDATVSLPNVDADNGIVHVINAVLLPNSITSIEDELFGGIEIFPNPSTNFINVNATSNMAYNISNSIGLNITEGNLNQGINKLNVDQLLDGTYFITLTSNSNSKTFKFVKN